MTDYAKLRAKIHYRATHRGTREADMLIGGFVTHFFDKLTENDLVFLEKILDEDDVPLMRWLLRLEAAPTHYHQPLLVHMQAYALTAQKNSVA